jgi:hypothetical protein
VEAGRRIQSIEGWALARMAGPSYGARTALLLRPDGHLYPTATEITADGYPRPDGGIAVARGQTPLTAEQMEQPGAFSGWTGRSGLDLDAALADGIAAIVDAHGLDWPTDTRAEVERVIAEGRRARYAPVDAGPRFTTNDAHELRMTTWPTVLGMVPLSGLLFPADSPGLTAVALGLLWIALGREFVQAEGIIAPLIVAACLAGLPVAIADGVALAIWVGAGHAVLGAAISAAVASGRSRNWPPRYSGGFLFFAYFGGTLGWIAHFVT